MNLINYLMYAFNVIMPPVDGSPPVGTDEHRIGIIEVLFIILLFIFIAIAIKVLWKLISAYYNKFPKSDK